VMRINLEIVVGSFMLLGLACLGYLAIKLGDIGLSRDDRYSLLAKFGSVSGLKEGAGVELAGVRVGQVSRIDYDPRSYEAIVELSIANDVRLQEDAIASVRTSGIIGYKFVKLTPGGSDVILSEGQTIVETESSINLEELISKYIFESGK